MIYIPFNYQGIPENLPIEQFEMRRKPEAQPQEVVNPLLDKGEDQEGKEETEDQEVVGRTVVRQGRGEVGGGVQHGKLGGGGGEGNRFVFV